MHARPRQRYGPGNKCDMAIAGSPFSLFAIDRYGDVELATDFFRNTLLWYQGIDLENDRTLHIATGFAVLHPCRGGAALLRWAGLGPASLEFLTLVGATFHGAESLMERTRWIGIEPWSIVDRDELGRGIELLNYQW